MKAGFITILTGKYGQFMDELVRSFHKHVDANLYIFTDIKKKYDCKQIQIEHIGWPAMPLLRAQLYNEYKDIFTDDYLYSIDGDIKFNSFIGEEILHSRVATLHRNLVRLRKEFNYEKRPESTAYIPDGEGEKYFIGGLYGGRREEFFKINETLEKNIKADIKKGIRAVWGDESHINRYFANNPPTKILSPEYMCNLNHKKFFIPNAKVYHLDKEFKVISLQDSIDRTKLSKEDVNYLLNFKFRK